MRIGVISDTHGSLTAWRRAVQALGDVDMLLHAGDVLYHGPRNPLPEGYDPAALAEEINGSAAPLVITRGNCDAEVDQWLIKFPLQSPYAHCVAGGRNVVMLHGHGYDSDGLFGLGRLYRADLIVCGHTHEPVLLEKDGVILLNPGSPSLPKEKDSPSAALIDGDGVRIFNLKENRVIAEKGWPV